MLPCGSAGRCPAGAAGTTARPVPASAAPARAATAASPCPFEKRPSRPAVRCRRAARVPRPLAAAHAAYGPALLQQVFHPRGQLAGQEGKQARLRHHGQGGSTQAREVGQCLCRVLDCTSCAREAHVCGRRRSGPASAGCASSSSIAGCSVSPRTRPLEVARRLQHRHPQALTGQLRRQHHPQRTRPHDIHRLPRLRSRQSASGRSPVEPQPGSGPLTFCPTPS